MSIAVSSPKTYSSSDITTERVMSAFSGSAYRGRISGSSTTGTTFYEEILARMRLDTNEDALNAYGIALHLTCVELDGEQIVLTYENDGVTIKSATLIDNPVYIDRPTPVQPSARCHHGVVRPRRGSFSGTDNQ